MKLVREHINEIFTEEDSDPIQDMGIGVKSLIKEWIEKHVVFNHQWCEQNPKKSPYKINDDGTIDTYAGVWIPQQRMKPDEFFPDYIQFNIVDGYFDMGYIGIKSLRGCPREVRGYFRCCHSKLRSLKYSPKIVYEGYYAGHNSKKFTKADVRKVCTVGGNINFEGG